MAHANRVLRSIELDGEGRCVDIFVRPDGSFGFEEYRRDVEDGRGWFALGSNGHRAFATEAAALDAACLSVAWVRARLRLGLARSA